MAVLPPYRDQGVGTALLAQLFAEAMPRFDAVSLSVSASNPALRLYERFGFLAVGEAAHGSLTMIKQFRHPLG
jgi:ribosomal protein S18 acetylase RimI-like enzyme